MKPRRLKRVVIKEELVALTGNHVNALVLNQLIYWSERTEDTDKFLEEEKTRNPDLNVELLYGWVYKKAVDLADELMLGINATTVRRHIAKLVDMKLLHERNNPFQKHDRTMQYRPDIIQIQKQLQKMGYALEGYLLYSAPGANLQNADPLDSAPGANLQNADPLDSAPGANSKLQNAGSKLQNAGSSIFPEITSEITSEITEDTPLSPPGDSVSAPSQIVIVEVLEPEVPRQTSNEGMTDNQTTNQTETVKTKDSGLDQLSAAPPPRTTKKYGTTEEDFEALRNLYNQHKPPGWAVWKRSGDKRIRLLRKFCVECGEETAQTLIDALSFVTNDDWWATRPLGIDTVLKNGKAIELAEKFESQQVGGGSAAPIRRRQQQTFSHIEQALSGNPVGAFS